jgi:hypothetical protein
LGILAILQFQLERPLGTLAILGILAILQFQLESESGSTRDPCDFKDCCDLAIFNRQAISDSKWTLANSMETCNFMISSGQRFDFHQEPLQFWGFF